MASCYPPNLPAGLDDPRFSHVTYRRGASGIPAAIIRGTGIRVQTIAIAHHHWGESAEKIAGEYGIPVATVNGVLAFYQEHQEEIDLHIRMENELEAGATGQPLKQ